jgi:hypothetical protein
MRCGELEAAEKEHTGFVGTQGHNGPGRDDGRFDDLPPVNIVVPDDASELDHDVRAYYRERRLAGARALVSKVFFTRRWRQFGLSGPILVAVLLLVGLIASMLAILGPHQMRRTPQSLPLAQQTSPTVGEIGGLLPATELLVGGLPRNSRELRPGVLALIPPACHCVPLLDDLFRQVKEYGYSMYLVGSEAMRAEIAQTVRDVGNGTAAPVVDPSGALTTAYAARGVTVLLVHADGIVGAVLRELAPGERLEPELAPLSSPGQTSLAPDVSSPQSGG